MVETYPLDPPLITTMSFSSIDASEYVRKAPKHLPKPSEEEEEAGIKALWIKANWPFHFPAIVAMDGCMDLTTHGHNQGSSTGSKRVFWLR